MRHNDLCKFIRILFYMSNFNLSSIRDFGSDKNERFLNDDEYEPIRKKNKFLHFNNSKALPFEDPNRYRLYLFRPVVNALNKIFESILMLDMLCMN